VQPIPKAVYCSGFQHKKTQNCLQREFNPRTSRASRAVRQVLKQIQLPVFNQIN